jgi:deazaflavin-dependent oxidoreductase (nitroreductase family)
MPDTSAIRAALDIGAISSARERTVDITTTGATSGHPRRIEIWFHQVEGRWYITGTPPRQRGWYRNLEINPRFTFHLKHDVHADLSATARPITDPDERHQILQRILKSLNDPSNPAGLPNRPPIEDWVAFSPLVEVTFDDLETEQQ